MRLRRIASTGGLALLLVGSAACGAQQPFHAATGEVKAVPPPASAVPSPAADPSTSPSPTVSDDGPAARRAFARGLATYCTRFYSDERATDEAYPLNGSDYDAALTAKWRTDQAFLQTLTPTREAAQSFAGFVTASSTIVDAFAQTVPGSTDDAFGDAIVARRPFARQLHAARCDGALPSDQRTAAAAALKAFDLTTDPHQACVTMVTSQFVATQWTDTSDPMAACVADRTRFQQRPQDAPKAVTVTNVTGVDGIQATVTFFDTGGCGCQQTTVARLYLVDGSWKIRSVGYA